MRRILLLPLLFIIFMSLVSIVSAEVIFGQTNTLYNLGDTLQISATAKPSSAMDGFLELNLVCGDSSINFYREYLSLDANEEKQVSSSVPLNRFFVKEAGICKIESSLNNEMSYSSDITVSDKIIITLDIKNTDVMPGQEITVEGSAKKENSQNVDGFVDADVNNVKASGSVVQGKFSVSLKLPENMRSGTYSVNVNAYEKIDQESELSNHGQENFMIVVRAVPKELEIALDSGNVNPGTTLSYKPMLYDQAHDIVLDKEIAVKIYDTGNNLIAEKVSISGKQEELALEQNALPGTWKIYASVANISTTKQFNVNALEQASFSLDNNTLTITNTGNVPYKKLLQFTIGKESTTQEVSLGVSETKKLKIYAPDGKYTVKVSDGTSNVERSDVLLTGRAVKILDASEGSSFSRYLLAWIFLFAVVGWIVYSKCSRLVPWAKKYSVNEDMSETKTHHPIMVEIPAKKMSEVALPQKSIPSQAEHTIALNGQRQESSVIALSVKNSEKMPHFKDLLNEITQDIVANKGSIYQSNNFLFGIFPPVSTKTYKNEVPAIRLAKQIEGKLNNYNSKFKEKINYGLTVHSGPLVVEKTQDKLKFTGLGNTLGMAKKVAEAANNEFLISEEAFNRASSDIKAFRETKDNMPVYKLNKIIEREDSDKFIRGFLDRNYK